MARRKGAVKERKRKRMDDPGIGSVAGALTELLGRKPMELVQNAMNYGLWLLFRATVLKKMAENFFSKFLDAKGHQVHGYDADAVEELWEWGLDRTLYFGIFAGREVTDEFIGEMLQEGLSYAVQTSMGGALQTILNVYRGGSPYPSDNTFQIGRMIRQLDARLAAFLTASAGYNMPTAGADLLYGALQGIDDNMGRLDEQAQRLLDEWNEICLSFIRIGVNMARSVFMEAIALERELAERYARVRERIAETHLARANEYLDSLEAIKRYYEAGFIDEHTYERNLIAIKAEIEASIKVYDEAIQALDEAYEDAKREISWRIQRAFTIMTMAVRLFHEVVERYQEVFTETVQEELKAWRDYLFEALDSVASYRNVPTPVHYQTVIREVEVRPAIDVTLKMSYTTPVVVAVTEKGKSTKPTVIAATEKGKATSPHVIAATEKGKYTAPSTGT